LAGNEGCNNVGTAEIGLGATTAESDVSILTSGGTIGAGVGVGVGVGTGLGVAAARILSIFSNLCFLNKILPSSNLIFL